MGPWTSCKLAAEGRMEQQQPRSRVLVVDDNEQNRALAQATLEDDGYEVVLAVTGEEGIRQFELHTPDCVLLDVLAFTRSLGSAAPEPTRMRRPRGIARIACSAVVILSAKRVCQSVTVCCIVCLLPCSR